MRNKIFTIATIIIAATVLSLTASAQEKSSAKARLFNLVSAAKQGKAKLNPQLAKRVRDAFSEERTAAPETNFPSIVGSWNCHVPTSDGGNAPFDALQTFAADGTFVETSSLLGMGGEGPAHGAYERIRRGYALTFELFVFDPETGESVGRVRVRAAIKMSSSNSFDAETAVDFIEPDGTVIPDIDGGPFSATRLQVYGN
ncbi:MAG: hypothetical protein ABL999_13155 [Pyrinomonadaceae bacterium]